MLNIARSAHLASSFALPLFMVAALFPPGEATAGQAYYVATEVMMEDITSQLLLVSAITGGPVSTGNTGLFTVQSDGSAYGFSFTAGGVNVTDTAALSPNGLAPGTGTWTINSNIITMGSALVSYDPGTTTYTGDEDYNVTPFIDPSIPHGYVVTDVHISWTAFDANWRDTGTGWYTEKGKKIPGTDFTESSAVFATQWEVGGGCVDLTGDTANGTFVGTANALPEPNTLVLASIAATGLYVLLLCRRRHGKR